MSIDLGKDFGWCYLDNLSSEYGESKYIDLVDWGIQFKKLLDQWKPEIVVLSQTNNFGHWNASRSMLQQAGVAFYICGKMGIPGIEFNDSSARKHVFGKALKKNEVQKHYPTISPNALDAYILAMGFKQYSKDIIDYD